MSEKKTTRKEKQMERAYIWVSNHPEKGSVSLRVRLAAWRFNVEFDELLAYVREVKRKHEQ